MFCPNCGMELQEDSKFCSSCGAPFEQFSKIIPIWKFILLSVITFGIYELIWFYRNWKFLKEKNKMNISPFLRAVFAPLFAASIAKHILELLKEKNYQPQYSSTTIGISYFVISALWRLPDPYWLISFFTFLPMIPIVKAMNIYWQKENPDLPLKNFLWWQIILVIFGVILFILTVIGTFIPE